MSQLIGEYCMNVVFFPSSWIVPDPEEPEDQEVAVEMI